jgi:ATP-dependent exoDNAse (exonuclease V) beta subunit
MDEFPSDQEARERFTRDWDVNLAVVANAGSGKTTAISERLAHMALRPDGAEVLARTAVVTYTNKAASQIGRRARKVLLDRLKQSGQPAFEPLARLDEAFFGTIHSFCILLARRHGSSQGVHLNPTIVDEDAEDRCWEEFIEQDPMQFSSLDAGQVDAFLRHAPLDSVFGLAKQINLSEGRRIAAMDVAARPPAPGAAAREALQNAAPRRKGAGAAALERNKATALQWLDQFESGTGRLPIPVAEGAAGGIEVLYDRFFAPLRQWLARAGGVLGAELSERYRAWRLERGIQTYADQVDTALAILEDKAMLERVRQDQWRVILDEAQDTDASQFSVLVEITRPPGSQKGTWPGGGGAGPIAGHFCMVGDAQQGIYSSRADIRNFQRHAGAFELGDCGERLTFGVTFRAPRSVVALLNGTLPAAFGRDRAYNFGVEPEPGAPEPFRQVDYEPLVAGPSNLEGGVWLLPIPPAGIAKGKGEGNRRLEHEAREIAKLLKAGGPQSVGARHWGDVCILAPRNKWLPIVRGEFERQGLKTALQMKRNRNGDNPVYAWLCGLLAVACDPENTFEWVGVLREVFAISDAAIADAIDREDSLRWDEPENYAAPVRDALEVVRPLIYRVDPSSGGESLGKFAADLVQACGLEAKALAADPEGGLSDELARVLAQADELGTSGAGPREWYRFLVDSLDELRASGRPAPGAINLITSHSAKGLEWPVVIPVGLWRKLKRREHSGLRIVSGKGGVQRVVFDNADLGAEAKESMEREWRREQVRLLYVVLTRAKSSLVVPWSQDDRAETDSLAFFWGFDPKALPALPPSPAPTREGSEPEPGQGSAPVGGTSPLASAAAPAFPERVLPHRLDSHEDLARASRHEASSEDANPARDGPDPIDYGLWWHEMLEFLPWRGDAAAVAAHGEGALERAQDKGFRERGSAEWERLLASRPWELMRSPRWTALAEVGIFAPLDPGHWIDGVIDLVLHDPAAGEVWIVDWKTNHRQAGEGDSELLARLGAEYSGQLGAYGACARGFFPTCSVRLWVYSTAAGDWTEVPLAPS